MNNDIVFIVVDPNSTGAPVHEVINTNIYYETESTTSIVTPDITQSHTQVMPGSTVGPCLVVGTATGESELFAHCVPGESFNVDSLPTSGFACRPWRL